jgi:hypothetical protein
MFVCCECCVLSGRGLCDELMICLEESYRRWYVVACDLETSWMRRPWPVLGRSATDRNRISFQLVAFQKHSLKNCACISCLCVPAKKVWPARMCATCSIAALCLSGPQAQSLQLCLWESPKLHIQLVPRSKPSPFWL